MGIIITINMDMPGRDPLRQLNTPEGDVRAINQRITDYLRKIKSETTTASIFRARDAVQAGLPQPPLDLTADIRAQVPEEMFPPVLIASNNETFTDFDGGYGKGYIVSQAFRDAVERFDAGVHQFIPVEIRRKDGGLHDKRPFYILRVTRLLNTINVAASPDLRRVAGKPTDPVTDTTRFHFTKNATFAVHADRTAGMGLWRDVRSEHDIFVSQRLVDLLREGNTTGWAANYTFTEV